MERTKTKQLISVYNDLEGLPEVEITCGHLTRMTDHYTINSGVQGDLGELEKQLDIYIYM